MSKRSNILIAGIDGGGTGCRVAIADQDRNILGRSEGGPANPTYTPFEARANILAAIEAARLDAGLEKTDLKRISAFAGLAGVRNEGDAGFIARALPFARAEVVEDRVTTVTGALGGQDGAVVAVGTGSFVAHSFAGSTQYIGGWGFHLGDQASGSWLGHELLKRVILCAEGVAPHSALTRAALARYDSPDAIYEFSIAATPAEFAELAPMVVQAAQNGDPVALELMHEGADYIVKALNAAGYKGQTPLCLTGGLGPQYAGFLPPAYGAKVVKPAGTALDGALLLAQRMEATV